MAPWVTALFILGRGSGLNAEKSLIRDVFLTGQADVRSLGIVKVVGTQVPVEGCFYTCR